MGERQIGEAGTPLDKPARGTYVLERDKARATAERELDEQKLLAKARDQFRCRWPEPHKCRGGLEAAHLVDASLGGPPIRSNLVTLCKWLHRRGPESIHGKQIKIEAETADGADGILSFWRKTEYGWHSIGRERCIGVLEKGER